MVLMPEPSFTLVQLRYFAAAADSGSMTVAARNLMVSQSAISTAIAQLEKSLGVQLLLRHHARGLTLTAVGADFLTETHSLLAHAADLEEIARDGGRNLAGELRIGWFSTLAPFRLPAVVAAFEHRHPAVQVVVTEDEHAKLKRSLREGAVELAVMYGYDLEADLERRVLDVAAPYAIVSSRHPLAEQGTASLHDLAGDPMVLLDLPYTAGYFTSLVEATGCLANVRFRSPAYETVRALVAHGHGFALLNQQPAHDRTYDGERVVSLRLTDELPPLEIVLVWVKGTRLTRRAQAFSQMIRTSYADHPQMAADDQDQKS